MKLHRPHSLPLACVLASSLCLLGCIDEGATPECGAGGRGNLEEADCVTPIGGTCLTHGEFVEDRLSDPNSDPPLDPEADWVKYKEKRPLCDFEDE